ncbi:hypothetical protein [uncultured Winogradskyella sp.]|uniref:hypothetical protein n=1 Tax=uncultured Winogradskyella sp. TaxID=395353 RepID=UPI00262C0D97|nr:hypothetical protein [uncultured Winogradskyella sp.]
MKQKIFKLKLLPSVLLLFILYGCQRDTIAQDTLQKNLITKKRVYQNDITKNTKVKDFIDSIDQKIIQKSQDNRTHSFNVLTDEAIYIEKENYHSYTFLIQRPNVNGLLENLVLSSIDNGAYKATIIQYALDSLSEIDHMQQPNLIPLENFNVDNLLAKDIYTCQDGEITIGFAYIGNADGILYEEAGDCINANSNAGCDTIRYWIPCHTNETIDEEDNSSGGSNDADDGNNSGNNGNSDGNDSDDGNTVGGGGSSGNNDDGSQNNDNEDNDDSNNTDNCFMNNDSSCSNEITSPVQERTDKKNCNQLNKLLEDYPVSPPLKSPRAAIVDLKNKLSSNNEEGYSFVSLSNSNPKAALVTNTNPYTINYKNAPNVYGGAHTHQNNNKKHPIPSGGDILALLGFSQQYNGPFAEPSLFEHITVTAQGVYAIKIEDMQKFLQLLSILNDRDDANNDGIDEFLNFDEALATKYQKYDANDNSETIAGSPTEYQREFLKFIADYDGNGSSIGIALYKADSALTQWNKLTLNDNTNIVESTPCNN